MSRRTLLPRVSAVALFYLIPVAVALSLAADESFLSKPPVEWTESEALQVLNDSPWARTVTTTTQDSQCDYKHPAFAGMCTDDLAQRMDSITPSLEPVAVKPDGAEYVIRLVSVKPMQAAVEKLISLDHKFCGSGVVLHHEKPTNVEEHFYNPADFLKRPGPDGASFLDYAFDKDKWVFPGRRMRDLLPCTAVRTPDGQSSAVIFSIGVGKNGNPSAVWFSFPSHHERRALISHPGERLQFRFIADQRVFEVTFTVNPSDLFDGSEQLLRIPSTVDKPANVLSP
jgi:hypothetical protein